MPLIDLARKHGADRMQMNSGAWSVSLLESELRSLLTEVVQTTIAECAKSIRSRIGDGDTSWDSEAASCAMQIEHDINPADILAAIERKEEEG